MKPLHLLTALSLVSMAACEEKPTTSTPSVPEPTPLPGPQRAAAAADRVRPSLTRDLSAAGLHFGDPVFLRAFKEERLLEVFVQKRNSGRFELFRTYPIAGSSGTLGPKLAEGDGQVPEGFYHVPPSAMNPASQFHLSFNIGYPNAYDRAQQRTGSAIMVHGGNLSIGCLAMTDPAIEEIYTLCAAAHHAGQPFFRIHIFPFRMTTERLATTASSPWHSFWTNLKEGHDLFESSRIPPNAGVTHNTYSFSPTSSDPNP